MFSPKYLRTILSECVVRHMTKNPYQYNSSLSLGTTARSINVRLESQRYSQFLNGRKRYKGVKIMIKQIILSKNRFPSSVSKAADRDKETRPYQNDVKKYCYLPDFY